MSSIRGIPSQSGRRPIPPQEAVRRAYNLGAWIGAVFGSALSTITIVAAVCDAHASLESGGVPAPARFLVYGFYYLLVLFAIPLILGSTFGCYVLGGATGIVFAKVKRIAFRILARIRGESLH